MKVKIMLELNLSDKNINPDSGLGELSNPRHFSPAEFKAKAKEVAGEMLERTLRKDGFDFCITKISISGGK